MRRGIADGVAAAGDQPLSAPDQVCWTAFAWICRSSFRSRTRPATSRRWSPRSPPRSMGTPEYEIVYVDDGSSDATAAEIRRLQASVPRLRLRAPRQSCGQSAAIRSGVKAAHGRVDRDARRRRPERPGRHPGAVADRPGSAGDAAAADRRASRAPPGQLVEATGLAHRQRGAPPPAARRHARYRLRAQAVPARALPRPALFRPHAPLPAGAGAARGRDRALGAGQSSPAPARHLEIRRVRPARGRHRRPFRRHLAAPPPRPARAGRGRGAAEESAASARPAEARRARPAPNRCGDDRRTHAGRLVVAALLAAGIVAAWRWRSLFDPLAMAGRSAATRWRRWFFSPLHVAASLFFVPRTLLALGAGLVFGMWWGVLWAALGSVVGAVAGFLVARYVQPGLVERARWARLAALLEARRARRLAHGRRAAAGADHPAQPDQLCAGADPGAARRLCRRLAARANCR